MDSGRQGFTDLRFRGFLPLIQITLLYMLRSPMFLLLLASLLFLQAGLWASILRSLYSTVFFLLLFLLCFYILGSAAAIIVAVMMYLTAEMSGFVRR